jgi:hypothetical protein
MQGIVEVYYDEDFKGMKNYTSLNQRKLWMQQQLKMYPQHKHYLLHFIIKPSEKYEKQYNQRNTSPPSCQRILARPTKGTTQYNWREIG